MTLPAVWVPYASGNRLAPTPAAEPEEEPPGVWLGLAGFIVGPGLRVANSVVTVFPRTMAPASRAQATGAGVDLGCQSAQMGEPYWLGMLEVSNTSFAPIGMPCSGPGLVAAAAARAWAGSKWAKARTVGSRRAMWSR